MFQKYHRYLREGWIILLVSMVTLPVLSWASKAPFIEAIGSTFFIAKLLGQVTGIIGAQLFAFSLILSARLHSLEKLFGGLDRLYDLHHKVGVVAFAFLAVHPIILSFQYIEDSFKDMANFLSPIGNTMPITLGIISLMMMLGLLFLTFYGIAFSYPSLKKAHRFLGVAFFFGFLHVFFIPSSLSTNILLKVILLGTSGIAIALFVYRSILGRFLVFRYSYTLSSIKKLGSNMTELTLNPMSNKKLTHLPGQFGILSFPHSNTVSAEEHPFTLSGAGVDGSIRFSIKALGDYTTALTSLREGEGAKIEGPFGEFSYLYGEDRQVWVAGGIGVTPFVSMAEHMLLQDTLSYTVDFFYSCKTKDEGVYQELFRNLQKKHASFAFHFLPSDTHGFITTEFLSKEVSDLNLRDIFICGPPGLMISLSQALKESGIKSKHIRTERFALLK